MIYAMGAMIMNLWFSSYVYYHIPITAGLPHNSYVLLLKSMSSNPVPEVLKQSFKSKISINNHYIMRIRVSNPHAAVTGTTMNEN